MFKAVLFLVVGLAIPVQMAFADGRLPVPDAEQQKASLALVKEVLEAEFSGATNNDGKETLVAKLFTQAESSNDDPAAKFVLLSQARDTAAEIANVEAIDKAVTMLGDLYQIDSAVMQVEAYQKCIARGHGPADNKKLAERSLGLASKALQSAQLDVAERLLAVASVAAGKAHDRQLAAQARARTSELNSQKRDFEAAMKALEALEKTPDDADANLIVGRYLCTSKGEWEKWFAHLAKSSESRTKELALQSLAVNQEPAAFVEAGDLWWKAAESSKGRDAAFLRSGARFWYAKALPALTGLTKAKVEKRLAGAGPQPTASASNSMPAGRSSVDVLKLIDLNRDVVGGKWERVPTSPALTVSGLLGLVQIPLALPVEYTLTVDVTRLARPTPLVAILPLPGRQCYVVVDSGETGLGLIDGEVANTNETSSNETRLKENKKATVVYRVTRAAITVAVDGKTVINFTGDFARLTLAGSRGYSLPSQMALGIGANGNGKLEISRIEVAPAD